MDRPGLVRAAGRPLIAAPVPLADLPAALLEGAPFQSSAAWWRCVLAAGMPPRTSPLLLLAHDDGRPAGLLPLRRGPDGLVGLVTPYTCLFQPVVAQEADLMALGRVWGRACVWPVLRLDALDPDWAGWPPLLAGFREAGFRAAWYEAFGNWRAEAGSGWDCYLAARPGALRQTIRRKLRAAERDSSCVFSMARHPGEVGAALAAYEAVYRRSWKTPEPFPEFAAVFVAEAAAAGVLRLGVLWRGGAPAAAQYWIVERGVARVEKLAHDEAAKTLSPGTVLTAWMIRALLAEGVTTLDFGRGDDAYKRLWAETRRQRRGLILARPFTPRGAAALLRQRLGKLRRAARAGPAGGDLP